MIDFHSFMTSSTGLLGLSSHAIYFLNKSGLGKVDLSDAKALSEILFDHFISKKISLLSSSEQLVFDDLLELYAELCEKSIICALTDLVISRRPDVKAEALKNNLNPLGWMLIWGVNEYGLDAWIYRHLNLKSDSGKSSYEININLIGKIGGWIGGIKSDKSVQELLKAGSISIFAAESVWYLTPLLSWGAVERTKLAKLEPSGYLMSTTKDDLFKNSRVQIVEKAVEQTPRRVRIGQAKTLTKNVTYPIKELLSGGELGLPHNNFHVPEESFTWTSKAVATIKFHIGGVQEPVFLSTHFHFVEENRQKKFKVFLNGSEVYSGKAGSPGDKNFISVLRDGNLRFEDTNELSFYVEKSFVEPGGGRELGVAVKGFGIYSMVGNK